MYSLVENKISFFKKIVFNIISFIPRDVILTIVACLSVRLSHVRLTQNAILNFGASNHNSGTTKATVVKFCTHIGRIKLVVLG